MHPPVFFIVGAPGSGKSTVRKIISELTKLKGGSCSDVIYNFLAIRRGISAKVLKQLPKEELRPSLIAVGDFLCGQGELTEVAENKNIDQEVWRHPSALIRTLYHNNYNVIDGVRRRTELQDAIKHLEWNGVQSLTIFVTRTGHTPVVDNTEDLLPLADEALENSGTEEELKAKVSEILTRRFGAKEAAA